MNQNMQLAIISSATPQAREAEALLREVHEFVPLDSADAVIVLGGDGHMLQVLHQLLESRRDIPAYGMNRGTIGFLMNSWDVHDLPRRLQRAKSFSVRPLTTEITTISGQKFTLPAINEVSLLRETRQAAKLEISVNGRAVIPELICDGILVSTPAGSTAYNLSANGPILPLDSSLLALTPISPFRPRRWKGAILPDRYVIRIKILEASKRPVSAVADQREIRDIAHVEVALDRNRALTLMFDPEHALDDRISMEQFIV
ncbi:MAG: NAD kinase [Sphingorhabdus sp.]|jgi:NAD+ kinase|uniref:NAD kinase n=1 Tax=Sphingorhabdus sp. TaxID=1902408 RepID=UPI0025E57C35|nr:NAD kinase [Sphingorhabdus sp.]MCO4091759.1 NAD kinase [Sphingorhabdus sp.]